MLLKIRHDESDDIIDGELFYDNNGNVILNINTHYYFLSIDSRDNLEFIEIGDINNLILNDKSIDILNIKNISDKDSLRKKIIDKIEEDEDKSVHSFSDEDDDEFSEHKLLPENKYYYVDGDYTHTKTEYFNFAKADKDSIINLFDRYIDGLANFDTLIIDKTINKIHFSSELNHKNSYRVTITLDGIFSLNVIGSKIITFDMSYNTSLIANDEDIECPIQVLNIYFNNK